MIKLLGQIQGATDGALRILGPVGQVVDVLASQEHLVVQADHVLASQEHLVVQADTPDQVERVHAVVQHLAGRGSLREALAAHCPALPAKALAIALVLLDGLTDAVSDDGQIDAAEITQIVLSAAKEAV